MTLATLDVAAAERALRHAERWLQNARRSYLLLREEDMDRVVRYEAHLERSLYRALHELQRLQAARNGSGQAPVALDLDVTVGPRGHRGFVSQNDDQ